MSLRDFKNQQLLGKGSYGAVYRAERKSDGFEYAIKEVCIKELPQREREDAVNEIRLLASVIHPNITRYCDAFVEGSSLYIVMEFAKKGDLHQQIRKFKSRRQLMPEETLWRCFLHMCKGLKYLHDRSILHRDLKPKNVFISEDDQLQIGDLGCSKLAKRGLARTQIGTPYYMSPEIWMKRPYDDKSDMWALGCVMYELAALRPPFMANDLRGLGEKVCRASTPSIPKEYSADLSTIVKTLLAKDPQRRPSVTDLLALPAVAERLAAMEARGAVKETPVQPAKQQRVLSTIKVPRRMAGRRLDLRLPASAYPVRRLGDSPSGFSSPGSALSSPRALKRCESSPAKHAAGKPSRRPISQVSSPAKLRLPGVSGASGASDNKENARPRALPRFRAQQPSPAVLGRQSGVAMPAALGKPNAMVAAAAAAAAGVLGARAAERVKQPSRPLVSRAAAAGPFVAPARARYMRPM